MAEFVFKSAGVSTREIDLSAPSTTGPSGIPAGVIGTSIKGPAFVPVTVASFSEFVARFGSTDGEKFGPLAVFEWLKNAQALTYIRVLGIGDGNKRNDSSGIVTNAGFVVGAQQVQANGSLGYNASAISDNTGPSGAGPGVLGRTHFLGCYMSQSAESTILSDAGIQVLGTAKSHPIIRGVILAASGIVPLLSGNYVGGTSTTPSETVAAVNNAYASKGSNVGNITGSVDKQSGKQEFTILLNGMINDGTKNNVITASFDPQATNYFASPAVMNRDPFKLEEKGYVLYTSYDVYASEAVITGAGIILRGPDTTQGGKFEEAAFLTTGSLGRNEGAATAPNYEDFQDRFTYASSPFVVSQGDTNGSDLFQIFALDAGEDGNTKVKITIENIKKSDSTSNLYGSFDLVVRDFFDTDHKKVVLEQYRGVNLDPTSDRFVARVVGDLNVYFDFDQASDSQRLVSEGSYPNVSSYIRIKQSDVLKAGNIDPDSLPVGFRGPFHLVTSGTGPLTNNASGSSALNMETTETDALKRAVEPPIPLRKNLTLGTNPNKRVKTELTWGAKFEITDDASEPNKANKFNDTMVSYTKFFPRNRKDIRNVSVGDNAGVADSAGTILDSDRFNNNFFSLERVQVVTASAYDGLAHPDKWVSASYVRKGGIDKDTTLFTRAWSVDDLKIPGNRRYSKFTFFLQGGYDGVNIFNKDKSRFLNNAAKREMDDSDQGATSGPTVAAYRKAVDIMESRSDTDIQVLVIPGLRHSSITDYATNAMEDRFDAIYIMDIEERDTLNTVVTSSAAQRVDVSNTVTAFKNRALDSSFAAAYFPDVIMSDPTTLTRVKCPPSVAVLGAFSLNDSIGYPWFAPAGFTRGALSDVHRASVQLNRDNMDNLYDADINPITAFPGTGVTVWGQKTLQAAESSLDRINVRRLLISLRRSVRAVANSLLFEPNREETLERFSSLVNPILQSVQDRSGVDRFKVVIDTSTTTQTDVENNTLRGKIFLQPTRTAEFIALDFVVTNAGSEI